MWTHEVFHAFIHRKDWQRIDPSGKLLHDSDLQFAQRELWFLFNERHRRIQLLYNETEAKILMIKEKKFFVLK